MSLAVSDQNVERAPVFVVEPRRGWLAVDWREIWMHRDLWWMLSLRDIKIRYKQTLLGAAELLGGGVALMTPGVDQAIEANHDPPPMPGRGLPRL